jgi:DNA-binding transcriptional regulator GbsR (MarR family)
VKQNNCADELIKELGRASERWGLSSVLGQVWGTLYFKGEMTQDRLKRELSIGLSSISQGIKVLESLGFISSTGKDGRKNIYKADFSNTILNSFLENLLRLELTPMVSLLKNRKEQAQDKELKDKITKLHDNLDESSKALALLLKFKK